jgi:chloramphenicol O-acetyltransferase type A
MREIDLDTWPRRHQFEFYRTMDYPHFNMCVNMDLTAFLPAVKDCDLSFTVAIVFAITRAANTVPEFRYRIRGDTVIEHEIVHPSYTVLTGGDLFGFCSVEYSADIFDFALRAAQQVERMREKSALENEPIDHWLYMTAIPWVTFTSFMHPMNLSPVDSVPRFAWGKYFEEGQLLKMPLSVQAHHALMDGIHMGRYYAELQDLFDNPGRILGGRS